MLFQILKKEGIVKLTAANADDEMTLEAMQNTGCKAFKYRGRKGSVDKPPFGIKLETEDGEEFQIFSGSQEQALDLDTLACSLFRTGRLRFLSVDDGVVTATTALCKGCENPIITWWETEGGVCDPCSEICEHDYHRAVAFSSKGSVFMSQVCKKCNRAMPSDSEDRTPEQIAQELHDEAGVSVVYRGKKD